MVHYLEPALVHQQSISSDVNLALGITRLGSVLTMATTHRT